MRRAVVAWVAATIAACGLLALPLVALAATSAVTIQGSAFNPPTRTVQAGDIVRWTNADAFSHTATSDTGLWDAGVITAGASASITFANAGTFAYHCTIHAFMKGTIVVLAATPAPTPPATPPPTAPPTPVRTAPPTVAPTAPPTAAPTEPTPTTPAPSPSPSPTVAAAETPTASASPSAVAVQVTPTPTTGSGPAPLLLGAAALAVAALGAIAFFLVRRS